MALVIHTNVPSLIARRHLGDATRRLQKSFARMSSGLRIMTVADDPVGLMRSERMRAQLRFMELERNDVSMQLSSSFIAEGALNNISDILIRLRELTVAANQETLSGNEKGLLDVEFQSMLEEIDRLVAVTGADEEKMIGLASTEALGIDGLFISDSSGVQQAIPALDDAIDTVAQQRSTWGARINSLQSQMRQIDVGIEMLTTAVSRIRDLDYAAESAELARATIMQQAALIILSQANVQPRMALELLRFDG